MGDVPEAVTGKNGRFFRYLALKACPDLVKEVETGTTLFITVDAQEHGGEACFCKKINRR